MITLTGEPKSTQHIYGQYCLGRRPVKFMTAEGKNKKALYQFEAKSQWLKPPLDGAVSLKARFYFKTRRRSDMDNFAKLLLDSMSGIVYVDDGQINELTFIRDYDKQNPRIEVEIESL